MPISGGRVSGRVPLSGPLDYGVEEGRAVIRVTGVVDIAARGMLCES
jgi:hypothetical protein